MVAFAGLAIRFDVVAIGAMAGLGYAILAAGLLLVYKAGRVINLAHGQIGAFSAIMLVELHHWGVPYAIALPLAILIGAAIGVIVERTLVEPLSRRSVLAVLVATIGVTQVLLVAQALLPDVIGAQFPTPINWTYTIDGLVLHGEHAALLVFGPIALFAFLRFLQRSRYGLAIRSVADNRQAARLAGIDPNRVGIVVWALAGGLAALAAILTLPLTGIQVGTGAAPTLGPGLLLRALAAGLAGRLTSLPRTILAGIAIGIVEAVLYATYPTQLGVVDMVLFVAILVMLFVQRNAGDEESAALAFGADTEPLPRAIRTLPAVRRARWGLATAAVAAAVLAPLIWSTSSNLFLLSRIPIFAIVGISLVILTGWAGQLTLGHMAFVGLGACGVAALASRGVPYGAAIGYISCAGIVIALIVGAPALRLRGLFLTVATLGLAVAASSYFLTQDLFRSGTVDVDIISPGKVGFIDAGSYRTDYYLCVVALVAVVALARRLHRSGIGRTIIAVEGNDRSAAAMTVSPAATKLISFAIAGGLATFAGALLAGVMRTFQVDSFSPDQSLQVLAMTVVGGIGSVGGAIAGAIYLIGVPTMFGDSSTARIATSGVGLLVLLRFEPSGLAAIAARLRDRAVQHLLRATGAAAVGLDPGAVTDEGDTTLVDRAAGEVGAHEAGQPAGEPHVPTAATDAAARGADTLHGPAFAGRAAAPSTNGAGTAPPLRVEGVSVSLGGRTIIERVDLEVHQHEIVGLIGANGAGKTTLMNAISGFVASTGKVELLGNDITGLAPHLRARAGLGRAFQTAQLFPRLTARDCVLVALEAQERSEVLPSLLGLPPAIRAERRSRAAGDELLELLGLQRYAETRVGGLSTGTRRIVELACLLATRPSVILLDEPMAGIAQRETEAFVPLIEDVRRELGASMLVIEHDLPLICAISDRLYCMETGSVIADGLPDDVRNDPRVVASYLGTDERAIARSDAARDGAVTGPAGGDEEPETVGATGREG